MKTYLVETEESGYLVRAKSSMDAIEAVMDEENYTGRISCRVMLDSGGQFKADPKSSLYYEAACLIERAEKAGVNLAIENRPLKPLSMGNTMAEIMIWPLRRNSL